MVYAFNRSLERLQSYGLRKTINSRLMRFPLITEGGLYYGEGTGLKRDYSRERRFLTRIVKGLFFHEFERTHPKENTIGVSSCWDMDFGGDDLKRVLDLITFIKPENKKTIGNEVFSYGYAHAEDHPNASFWVLTFFQACPFFVRSFPTTSLVE